LARRKSVVSGLEVSRPTTSLDAMTNTGSIQQWPGLDISDGSIDLRNEMADLLEKHGHYAYLRRSTGRRCFCWDNDTRESNPDCPHCTGEGWEYEDVPVTIRKMLLTDPASGTFLQKSSPVGMFSVGDQVIWVKYDKKPTRMDKILEVTLGSDGNPTLAKKIEMIWEINWAQDYRDKWGRVEFWGCLCHNTGVTK